MIFMHNKQFNQCNHVDNLKNQLIKQIPLIFLALHSKQFQCNHVDN